MAEKRIDKTLFTSELKAELEGKLDKVGTIDWSQITNKPSALSGIARYNSIADLPASADDGTPAIVTFSADGTALNSVYLYDSTTSAWKLAGADDTSVDWSQVANKPTNYVPSAHIHAKADITDFPANLSAFSDDVGYVLVADFVDAINAKVAVGTFDTHNTDLVRHITSEERIDWNSKATGTHNHDVSYAPAAHDHDGRYYTESEINTLLAGKMDASAQISGGSKDISVFIPGDAFVTTNIVRIPIGTTRTVTKVRMAVITAPTGADLTIDVNKNGSTMFTTQANRPRILSGLNTSTSGAPNLVTLSEGDILSIDIDQVGSTVLGNGLSITIQCT